MQTSLAKAFLATPNGQQAEKILRACVHCGFCTATCPTYLLLGDERDGPRGRIYFIKQMLEGQPVSENSRIHLDRCLSCKSCETTCPSGVHYGQLLDIGRLELERRLPRPFLQRVFRVCLRAILPYPKRFSVLLRTGQYLRSLLPEDLHKQIPSHQQPGKLPQAQHDRRVILFPGCVQSVATPATSTIAARILDRMGISVIFPPSTGCCGAVDQHLSAPKQARARMRQNIDAWWPELEQGAEAVVVGASGCGAMLTEYGHLLADDPIYADKAKVVARKVRDLSQILEALPLEQLGINGHGRRVAFHTPCSLQHSLLLGGRVEKLLQRLNFSLAPIADSHLCCGSAGTYSILQKELSRQMLNNKINTLENNDAEVIATANIGCQLYLATAAHKPVVHWIELLEN
ncbi:MAG TPA: glycolate oxidase subunit GlcF [Gammaproteobacteria bacterium]|nr:glycolate oxidase subunit GlcF [Gammaproteobacteria bacterium]